MKKEYIFMKADRRTEQMANLQIKGMDDELYNSLKDLAASENRSISQQVLFLLKRYLGSKHQFQKIKTPAQVLLELAGSWEDVRSSEKIMKDLKKYRKNSQKLARGF
jgi:hypothetical protein